MHWILAHLIGDYLLQNDWMAQNKQKSSWACTVHVATYMIPFFFCGLTEWQFLLIAIQHWVQDRASVWIFDNGEFTDGKLYDEEGHRANQVSFVKYLMIKTGHRDFTKEPFAPWSIILTDNIIHILWMAWVVSL
jgi:hypothetical protein